LRRRGAPVSGRFRRGWKIAEWEQNNLHLEPMMSSSSESAESRDRAEKNDQLNHSADSLRIRVRHAARQIESKIIREALEQHQWNRRRTAQALKISYRSLMYKMKTCNLRDSGPFLEGQQN
jgi:DNA-binding NtrC family response regulator